MPIDSTADLLFRIGANSDDAESNLQRFRSLLSKDLGAMGTEFEEWSKKTFGAMDTAAAVGIAGTAALATAIVAAAGAAMHATEKYERLVEEIEHGSRITNLSAETMSGLHLAAQLTGTSFDTLTRGIAFFERQVHLANQGGAQQLKLFDELGVSRKQLAAGEADLIPLLDEVAKRFHNLGSGAERVAIARGLFSRSGVEDQKVLDLLAGGIEKVVEQARQMGLVITREDVVALEKQHIATTLVKGQLEALAVTVGRLVLPQLTAFAITWGALAKTISERGFGLGWIHDWLKNIVKGKEEMEALQRAQERFGDGPPGKPGGGVEKVTQTYEGLSNVMEKVNDELATFGSEEAQAEGKWQHLTVEMAKALEELKKKKAEAETKGEKFEGYDTQLAAWQEFAEKMPILYQLMMEKIATKRKDAEDQAAAELNSRLVHEMEQTRAVKEVEWNWEMDGLVNKYRAQKDLTYESEQALENLVEELRKAGLAKIARTEDEAAQQATTELQKRLAERGIKTLASEHAQYDAEVDALREKYAKEHHLGIENEAIIAQIRAAGHAKIDADSKAAFDSEMARLGEEAQRIAAAQMTADERIAAQYQADVVKFTAAEEKKSLALATSETQRWQIQWQFAALRAALHEKEQADLQQLQNSTGWQGVFGAKFAESIRGNEALSKEWATSQQQAQMMVRVAAESTKEMLQQSFQTFADGMGAAIAQAIVYSKSIGEAMKAATAAALEQLSARALGEAIYSAALGFLCLAEGDLPGADLPGAASAFEAAALFGSIGVAAGVAGRAVAGPQNRQGAAAGGAPAPGAGSSTQSGAAPGTAATGSGRHVTVNIWGHVVGVSGVGQLCDMLSDAVLNKDHTLTATNTKSGVQITR